MRQKLNFIKFYERSAYAAIMRHYLTTTYPIRLNSQEKFIIAKSAIMIGDNKTAENLLDQLDGLARTIIQVRLLTEAGQTKKALVRINKKIKELPDSPVKEKQFEFFLYGEIWGTCALLNWYAGNNDKAILASKKAAFFFKPRSNPILYWKSLLNLAVYYEKMGEQTKKGFIIDQVCNDIKGLEYSFIHALVDRIKGVDAYIVGDYYWAEVYLERAFKFLSTDERRNEKIRILCFLAELALKKGCLGKVSSCLVKLGELVKNYRDNTKLRIKIERLRNNFYFHQTNFHQAFEGFESLLASESNRVEEEDIARDYLERLLICNKFKKARLLLERFRHVFYNQDDGFYTLDIRPMEAWLLLGEGKKDQALELANESLAYAKRSGKKFDMARLYRIVATIELSQALKQKGSKQKELSQKGYDNLQKAWKPDAFFESIIQIGIVNRAGFNKAEVYKKVNSLAGEEISDHPLYKIIQKAIQGERIYTHHDPEVSEFLKQVLGFNLVSITTNTEPYLISPELTSKINLTNKTKLTNNKNHFDFIWDSLNDSLQTKHKTIDLTNRPVVRSLLALFMTQHVDVKCGESSITKEDFVKKIWQRTYNPLLDEAKIYTAISRLNNLLGVDFININKGQLKLNKKIDFAVIDKNVRSILLRSARTNI